MNAPRQTKQPFESAAGQPGMSKKELVSFFYNLQDNLPDMLRPIDNTHGEAREKASEDFAEDLASKVSAALQCDLDSKTVSIVLNRTGQAITSRDMNQSQHAHARRLFSDKICATWPKIEENLHRKIDNDDLDAQSLCAIIKFCQQTRLIPSNQFNQSVQNALAEKISEVDDKKLAIALTSITNALSRLTIAPNAALLDAIEKSIDHVIDKNLAEPREKTNILQDCATWHACGIEPDRIQALANKMHTATDLEEMTNNINLMQFRDACLYFDLPSIETQPHTSKNTSNNEKALKQCFTAAGFPDQGTPAEISAALGRDVDHTTTSGGGITTITETDGPLHFNTHTETGERYMNGSGVLQTMLLLKLAASAVILRMDPNVTMMICYQIKRQPTETAIKTAKGLFGFVVPEKLKSGAHMVHTGKSGKPAFTPMGQYVNNMRASINPPNEPA